jgi:hypothetical protein
MSYAEGYWAPRYARALAESGATAEAREFLAQAQLAAEMVEQACYRLRDLMALAEMRGALGFGVDAVADLSPLLSAFDAAKQDEFCEYPVQGLPSTLAALSRSMPSSRTTTDLRIASMTAALSLSGARRPIALAGVARELALPSATLASAVARAESLARRIEDWFAGLERRVAAHEAAPSEATWSALIDHLRQADAMEKETDAKKIKELMSKRDQKSTEALMERSHSAIYAPARAAAQARDWQTVEVWADRILQLNPRDAEARSLKDQAVAPRAAEAPSSAKTAAEPAPTKSIEKAATKGLADTLSESEARRLLGQGIAAYSAESGGGHKQNIQVRDTKLWTSGVVYSLTQVEECWPKQPPAKMPGWYEIGCKYHWTAGCELLPYEISMPWIRVNRNGVAPSCTNVVGALLGQGDDGAWYAHWVEIVTHKPKLGKIVEILTRDDTARVRYTINWRETAIYKKWAHDDPELMARYPAPSGDMHFLLKMPACLRKYDQGWRLEGFGEIFNRC